MFCRLHEQDLYDKAGLPDCLPSIRKVFYRAVQAGLSRTQNPEKRAEYEGYILSQAQAARLVLEADNDKGLPSKQRQAAAMSPLLGAYITYSQNGMTGAVSEFGLYPAWHVAKALFWINMLKSPQADFFVNALRPGQLTRELMAACIIEGFDYMKQQGPRNPEAPKAYLETYRTQYARALKALDVDSLPESIRTPAQKMLRELPAMRL